MTSLFCLKCHLPDNYSDDHLKSTIIYCKKLYGFPDVMMFLYSVLLKTIIIMYSYNSTAKIQYLPNANPQMCMNTLLMIHVKAVKF